MHAIITSLLFIPHIICAMSEQPNAQKIKTMRDSISHAVSDSSRKASSKYRSALHQKLAADLLELGKAVAPCNSKVAHRRTASVPLPAAGGTPKPQIGNLSQGVNIHANISGRKSGTDLTSSCSSAGDQSQRNEQDEIFHIPQADAAKMARYVPLYANLQAYRHLECIKQIHDEFARHTIKGTPLYHVQSKAEDKRAYFRTRCQAIVAIYDKELGSFNRTMPETIEAILDSYFPESVQADQKEQAEVAQAQKPSGCCTIL